MADLLGCSGMDDYIQRETPSQEPPKASHEDRVSCGPNGGVSLGLSTRRYPSSRHILGTAACAREAMASIGEPSCSGCPLSSSLAQASVSGCWL